MSSVRTTGRPPLRVGLISLEPWDGVWRRNQHLAAQLLEQGLVRSLVFVCPPAAPLELHQPDLRGLSVVQPQLRLAKRIGGLRELGLRLRRSALSDVDVLWINDPVVGSHCLRRGDRAVYDVTDDWRDVHGPARLRRRVVRAEDFLSRRAVTVVCSVELRRRWMKRYGVDGTVINNGIDARAWQTPAIRSLAGRPPHIGYVGTLHEQRLDLHLIEQLASDGRIGTVHLVGPDALSPAARHRLEALPRLVMHGPVEAAQVPSWTSSFNALVCPHLINDFTLSLDAIKSYEYLASGRPVVATPTSGFQALDHPQLTLASGSQFVDEVARRSKEPRQIVDQLPGDWYERAREFAAVLRRA